MLTETWTIPDTSVYNLNGYKILYNGGNLNQNDGVIIFVKSTLYHSHSIVDFNGSSVIQLNTKVNNEIITINAYYRSPSTCVYEFIDKLKEYLNINNKNSNYNLLIGYKYKYFRK